MNERINGKDGVVHILRLGIDPKNKALHRACKRIQENRFELIRKGVTRMQGLGFDVKVKDVLVICGKVPNFRSIFRALLKSSSNVERLKDFLKTDHVPTYEEAEERLRGGLFPKGLDMRTAIRAIQNAGGIPVLAHANLGKYGILSVPDKKIREYAAIGMRGIELSRRWHTPQQNRHYMRLAKKFGLIATIGSDSHKL